MTFKQIVCESGNLYNCLSHTCTCSPKQYCANKFHGKIFKERENLTKLGQKGLPESLGVSGLGGRKRYDI